MKGLVVERARPSNAIDVFPLIKQAVREGAFLGAPPSDKQLADFYIRLLTKHLPSETHLFYLAKRGRGYLGLLHATLVPGRWDGQVDRIFVDMVFTTEKKRKMGVGKKLIDQLIADGKNMGIREFEFLARDELVDYWQKQRQAKKVSNLMRVVV